MFAYWGRRGALPQLTLELAKEMSARSDIQATISVSRQNEIFDQYAEATDNLFGIDTFSSAAAVVNPLRVRKIRHDLEQRIAQDGTRVFVTLMSHVWMPLIRPVLRKAGVRHVVIVHDTRPHPGDTTGWVNRWLLREAKAADHIVTLSSHVARQVIEEIHIPRSKVSVLYHPDLIYERPKPRTPCDQPIRVLFFGRLLPYKGLSNFIRAAELLKERHVRIQIGVYGSGDIRNQLPRLAALGAAVENTWIDPSRVADIFARHDLVVVPHIEASQSGIIATAYGARLPVIATPVGGLVDQVSPNKTGLLTADCSAEAIADTIQRVVYEPGLLDRLHRGVVATSNHREMRGFVDRLLKLALEFQTNPATAAVRSNRSEIFPRPTGFFST